MSEKEKAELQKKFKKMEDEKLVAIVTVDKNDYASEAVELARIELSNRNIRIERQAEKEKILTEENEQTQKGDERKEFLKGQTGIGWVAGVLGVYLGTKYFGATALVPFGAIFLAWLLGQKIIKFPSKAMSWAFTIQAGYLIWITIGVTLTGRTGAFADILVLLIGLTWFVLRPRIGSIIFLSIYHIIAFLVNLSAFSTAQIGSSLYKNMLLHMILRAGAVFFMSNGLWLLHAKKKKSLNLPSDL